MNNESVIQKSMAERYHQMLNELSGYIKPDIGDVWDKFINMINVLLKPTEVCQAKTVFDICNKLCEKGLISYGEYGKLLAIFEIISHKQCQDIVKKYSSVNTDARKDEHMRSSPEPKIGVDPDVIYCPLDTEKRCQLGLIRIATNIKDKQLSNEGFITNTERLVKIMIKDRDIMKEKDFNVLIPKKECNRVCVFIKTTASVNNKLVVERMENLLLPDIFIYNDETLIREEQGSWFYLKILTKFFYEEDFRPRTQFYKSKMKKLLIEYNNKSGKLYIDITEITNESGKLCVHFKIEAENFKLEDFHDCLEKHCGEPMFEEISLCQQEHLHATWFPVKDECNIKTKLEEELNKSKKENMIYDFRTCCTRR